MPRIRALIADDSVVVRRLVSDTLSSDPQIEVIGTAANGHIAVAKVDQMSPDIVILDVEMPDMDGLQALALIRQKYPMLPVIMFSTLTERGASATLEALSLGANDYVTKPANVGSIAAAMQKLKEELIPMVKLFCPATAAKTQAPQPVQSSVSTVQQISPGRGPLPRTVDAIGIGVSTGGPNALTSLLPLLPRDLPVPIFIVQHMPPLFTKLLAERLTTKCSLRVVECTNGEMPVPGSVYIAPGDHHMTVIRNGHTITLRTTQTPPVNSCRPAVDPLFQSLAQVYGSNLLVAVLTGMGQDGMVGAEHVREAGGWVMAQDEESSVVWGMPGAVVKRGLADKVVTLERLAQEVIRLARSRNNQPLEAGA